MTHSAIGGAPMPAPLVNVTDAGSWHAWNCPTPEPIAWIQRSLGATVAMSSGASSDKDDLAAGERFRLLGGQRRLSRRRLRPQWILLAAHPLVVADLERDGHELDLWVDGLQAREIGDAGHGRIRNVYDERFGHRAP